MFKETHPSNFKKASTSKISLGGISFVVGLVLAVVVWHLHFENQRLRQEHSILRDGRETPLLVNGFKVDFSGTTLIEDSPTAAKESRQRLVLTSSDSCTFSRSNIPKWEALITQTQWSSDQEVWLVTLDGSELAAPLIETLKASKIPFRYLRVDNAFSFPLISGFAGTPLTMILDGRSAVDLIAMGELGEARLRIFLEHLNSSRPQ